MKNELYIDHECLDLLSNIMIDNQLTLSLAESCTGGFLASCFTSISGSSSFFKGGIVSYSNESKTTFLDINQNDINQYGVVSKVVAEKMANRVRQRFNTDYGLATTGYLELSNLKLKPKNYYLHAWISISHQSSTISKSIILKDNRLQNMSTVACELLNLFVKEIP